MRENRIRTLWAASKAAVNGWLAIPNVFSAETMAHAGWDALTIDMQHGVVDYDAALSMLTAISTTSVAPVVRVPWLHHENARCGRLWHHLPDGEHPRRRRALRLRHALPASGQPQLRPD